MNAKTNTEPTVTAQTLLRDMMNITLAELKLGHDPWRKLSEAKQGQIIDRVANQCRDLLREMVALISSQGFQRVQVTLDQVVIKDGIKGQISLSKSDANWHGMCDAQGSLCTLVLAQAAQFTDAPHGFAAELDQLDLGLANPGAGEAAEAANDGGDGPDVREAELVTQEQIDAANKAIDDARAAHAAAGGSDDALDLTELTSKRDLLVLAYAQQQAMNPAYLGEQIAKLDEQIIDARNANAATGEDTPEIAQMVANRDALAAQLQALQQPTPTAEDLAKLDAEVEAAREAVGGFVDTPEVVALLEKRAAMADQIQRAQVVTVVAEPESVAKAA